MQRPSRSRVLLRRRLIRFARLAGYGVAGIAALLALVQVQRAALRTIQQSGGGPPRLNATPLLTLSGVEIRARSGGKPLLHLTADSLVLARDLREVEMTNVRGGADTPAYAMPGGSPIRFAAGEASLLLNPGFQQSADLRLTQTSADTRIGNAPLHIAAGGLLWQWPHGLAQTIGRVNATVGGFGSVECDSLSLNIDKKIISFGPLQATVMLAALGSAANFAPSASAQSSAAPGAGKGNLQFFATQTAQYSENNSVLTIDGPVRVVQGSVTMRTVGVVYNNITKVATALSPVTINDNQDTLTGNHGALNFGTHIATITGDVHMSAVPTGKSKSEVDQQANQPATLLCDHVTYNYRTKLADADGHLKVLQTNRTVTADTGHYDVNAQLITMHGNVDGRSTDGKHLQAPEAVVSVNPKDEWIQVKGPITYEFTVSDQDNPLPAAVHPINPPSSTPASPSAPASNSPASGAAQPASGSATSAPPATTPSAAATPAASAP